MSSLHVDLYWSFRSPYSYLVTPRVVALARDFDVDVGLRIVHPAAVRNPAYFKAMNALARPYFFHDSQRMAQFLGLPFRRPVPDPITQDPVTLAIAAEQPMAWRLGRLGVAAVRRGRGLAFASEVASLLWDGGTDDWDRGSHLADAAARAGLSLADLERDLATDTPALDAALDANDVALRSAGHWGVPTLVFEGEPFFGQDRFEVLVWRLQQHGLQARAGAGATPSAV